jgi:streptomycin 6-kinase
MRAFWRKPPAENNFPALEDWFANLVVAEKNGFPASPAARARNFFDELNEAGEKMLLHGDFHHENILSATRAPFLAIDPKGIVGGIGYDVAVFMINHANWLKNEPDLPEKLNRTIGKFAAAFAIEPQNLRKWIFAHTVLSASWSFEGNSENWKDELAFAEIWNV